MLRFLAVAWIFSPLPHPEWLCEPLILPPNGYWGYFPWR